MLKDRFFYPLAAVIVAGMVVFALSLGGGKGDLTDREIWENGYIMTGEDLVRLTVQPGTQATFVAAAGTEPAFARLTSTAARESLDPGPGVFAPLGPQYEHAFANRNLRMTITARSSRINPLVAFDMGYFSAGSKDSGWLRRELTDEWADYVMEFNPGPLTERRGLDHFSIWPGETADILNMDVKKMRVEVLNPPS